MGYIVLIVLIVAALYALDGRGPPPPEDDFERAMRRQGYTTRGRK